MATELNTYIGQKCDCFPLTYITSAQFTCPIFPPPHPQHYVTYRANIAPTGQLNRTELEAVLREWLAVHRAILLQGELLSVDNTCPIIINSFDDEQCTHDPITTTMDATLLPSDTHPVTLSLTSFLISVMAVAGLALIIVLLISLFFFTLYRK